jgi:UDP-3-O-[3-hydroxymyristoyl] N-acetylglucosamine deacetylase/3-hydroxyacyl-[acyl-carrier-protein] dehydratase
MDIHKLWLCYRTDLIFFIDRIIEMSDSHVVGMNVTMNENFFVGHFPEAPVMPGNNCRSNGTNRRDISIEYSSRS